MQGSKIALARSYLRVPQAQCRASEKFDISSEIKLFPMHANIFCGAGQVPILRYFEASSAAYLLD